jgi:hypothetical protein
VIVAVFVAALYDAVAGTCVPSGRQRVNVVVVNVTAFIARVKLALIGVPLLLPVGTFVAPAAGLLDASSGAFVVVNVQLTGLATATPSAALAPVVICAVYVVEFASCTVGASVAVVHGLLQLIVAATGEPPLGVSVKLDGMVDAFIARENVAVGFAKMLTPEPEGVVPVIVGISCTSHV